MGASKEMSLSARQAAHDGGGSRGEGVARRNPGRAAVTSSSGTRGSLGRSYHNPIWMRKLEDRYQRLHSKVLTIPHYQSAASRFSLLTRRLLTDAVAKAAASRSIGDDLGQKKEERAHHEILLDEDDDDEDDAVCSSSSSSPGRNPRGKSRVCLSDDRASETLTNDNKNNDFSGEEGVLLNERDNHNQTAYPCPDCLAVFTNGAVHEEYKGLCQLTKSPTGRFSREPRYPQRPYHPRLPPATPYTTSCSEILANAATFFAEIPVPFQPYHHHHCCHNHRCNQAYFAPDLSGGVCLSGCDVLPTPTNSIPQSPAVQSVKFRLGTANATATEPLPAAEHVGFLPEGCNHCPISVNGFCASTRPDTSITEPSRTARRLTDKCLLPFHPHHRSHLSFQSGSGTGTASQDPLVPSCGAGSLCTLCAVTSSACQQSAHSDAAVSVPDGSKSALLTARNSVQRTYDGTLCALCHHCRAFDQDVRRVAVTSSTHGQAVNTAAGEPATVTGVRGHNAAGTEKKPIDGEGESVGRGGEATISAPCCAAGWLSHEAMKGVSAPTAGPTVTFPNSRNNHNIDGAVVTDCHRRQRKSAGPRSSELSPRSETDPMVEVSVQQTSVRARKASRTVAARPGPSASRGGQQMMKVFERMSMEARHAVTETLQEMGAAREACNSDSAYDHKSTVGESAKVQKGVVVFDGNNMKEDALESDRLSPKQEVPATPRELQLRCLSKAGMSEQKQHESRLVSVSSINSEQNSLTTQYQAQHPPVSSNVMNNSSKDNFVSFDLTASRSDKAGLTKHDSLGAICNHSLSVPAPVQGGRTPRMSVTTKKVLSTTDSSTNARKSRLKSAKTVVTSVAAQITSRSERTRRSFYPDHHLRQQQQQQQQQKQQQQQRQPHQNHHTFTTTTSNRKNSHKLSKPRGDIDLDLDLSVHSAGDLSRRLSRASWGDPGDPVEEERGSDAGGRLAGGSRFPDISSSRTDPQQHAVAPPGQDGLRPFHCRIQGVGSYHVARETTFEITAPDFDVRYREVISCQKGGRETPPEDIFRRSVGKVKDWLSKYNVASTSSS